MRIYDSCLGTTFDLSIRGFALLQCLTQHQQDLLRI